MREVPRVHYVYVHRRASDGRPFYVGKGKDRRAWATSGRNRRWRFIAAKHGFSAEVIRDRMPESCALTLERIVIAANRDIGLANYTDGGGGAIGWRHSPEVRALIGARGKGRKLNEKQREALREANRNRVFSEATRRKMSEAATRRKGRVVSEQTRAKIAASHLGLRPSDETLRKMSLSKIGKAVGRNSPSYDHTERHWMHRDGSVFVGTRADFIRKFNLSDPCVSAVISGRRKTVKGWRLK